VCWSETFPLLSLLSYLHTHYRPPNFTQSVQCITCCSSPGFRKNSTMGPNSGHEYTIVHRKSSQHVNADALSRLPLPTVISHTPQPADIILLMEEMKDGPITSRDIKTWTRRDPILSRVVQYVLHGWPAKLEGEQFRPFWQKRLELTCQDGCLLWGSRVVIPTVGQSQVLEELHSAHPGATRIKRIAHTLVWWHCIDKDIDQQVRSCLECQRNQASPPEILVQPWHWPTRPWSRVHADFAGPINGQMLFILIDAYSKWIEAHPLMSITATATICLSLQLQQFDVVNAFLLPLVCLRSR